jgi:hypothetical protein
MAVPVTCPHCSKAFIVHQPRPGIAVNCPWCAGIVNIWEALRLPGARAPRLAKAPPQKPGPALVARRRYFVNVRTAAWAGVGAMLLAAVGLAVALVASARSAKAPPELFAAEDHLLSNGASRNAESPAAQVATEKEAKAKLPATVLEPEQPAAEVCPVEFKAAPTEPPIKPEPVLKRRNKASDEELRCQLLKMREVTLEPPARNTGRVVVAGKQTAAGQINEVADFLKNKGLSDHFTPKLLMQRTDLNGLPYRMGADCQLDTDSAKKMQAISLGMRSILAESMPPAEPVTKDGPPPAEPANKNKEPQADQVRSKIGSLFQRSNRRGREELELRKEDVVPCLMQMLPPEHKGIREVLVEQLAGIDHKRSTEGLAKLAVFDLSADIRAEAVKQLGKRPAEDYRAILLSGLHHPWAPAADHAAEALVALEDRDALPALQKLVKEGNPSQAYYDNKDQAWKMNELVRVNHLSNCLMCHAPSKENEDLIRGRIPSPGAPLPPISQYYQDSTGPFVRADVTYLRQDFSVMQPVKNPGPWPVKQRFDYVVQTRPATTAEIAAKVENPNATYPQREAVLYAIKELAIGK